MIKKLLFTLLILFTSVVIHGQITITTTSASATWSPIAVTNSGAILQWDASGGGITPQTIVANDPTFDFTGNSGTVTVVVTSSDNFVGLTNLRFSSLNISSANIDEATNLGTFFMYSGDLTDISLTQNTLLQRLNVQSNNLASLDVSTNVLLNQIRANQNNIASLNISANNLLTDLRVRGNNLLTADLDQIVIDLDNFGLSDGNLEIANNIGTLSSAALTSFNNLIGRGWIIDVAAPVNDTEAPVIGTLNQPSNVGLNSLTLTWTAATDNVGVTNYSVFQDNVLIATIGNVLTYNVTGLAANTSYNFHITALDVEGNESNDSNTVQATTLNPSGGNTITFTTTSTSSEWSPVAVTNSGAILQWDASGGGITPQTIVANDPTFDFTGNTGTVTVVATSSDNFVGLTNLRFPAFGIATADIDNAIALSTFFMYSNALTAISLTQNTQLLRLNLNNNDLVALDVSTNVDLNEIRANGNNIDAFSITNNGLVTNLQLRNNNLTTADLNQIVIDLDNFGLSNGNLELANNTGTLSSAALTSYNNLIGRGWTIDVVAPVADIEPPVIGTLNPATNITQTGLTLSWTPATDNVGVNNYSVFQDNVLVETIGNVLTYNVTGLTANTSYNFHITALDTDGNESNDSNTVQATTLNISGGNTITFTTTSTVVDWSPVAVANSGAILQWEASGGGITPQTIIANDPTFDFTGNTGTVTVVATSSDNFNGLTNLRFSASDIATADIDNAIALSTFFMFSNNLTAISVTQNTQLQRLNVNNNNLAVLDVSTNTALNELRAIGNNLATLSLANNILLTDVQVRNNNLTTADLNQIVIDLDNFGLSNGNLSIANNTGTLSSAALTSYNNLIGRGWTIDVVAPIVDTVPPIIGTLNPATNITQTGLTLSWTAATDNVGVTNYSVFQDNVLVETIGNVLTYNVTGLTANTSYNFHVTALDVEGNESNDSNTVQATTLNISGGNTITFTTTSTLVDWSPVSITNSGAVLQWEASGGGITPQTIIANDPTFDFTGNTGTVTVVATSSDNFIGLTNLRFSASNIATADVNNAVALGTFFLFSNDLDAIILTQNTQLQRLNLNNNNLVSLDLSANTLLNELRLNSNNLTTLDISNNPLLLDLQVRASDLPSTELDQIVIDLDNFGLSNGNLSILNNIENISPASLSAYNSLIDKGWTIDVGPPLAPGAQINLTGNGLDITNSGAAILANGTNFGETTLGNPITNQFFIENNGDEDLILSFIVSSSTDFPITLQPASLTIAPGANELFEVSFSPATLGTKNGSILISSNDLDTPVFVMNVSGDAVEVLSNEIMISQYYQGFSGTDNWIEVTNISDTDIPAGTYFLTLFDHTIARSGLIESSIPTQSEPIPAIAAGETIVFKNAAAALPSAGNIGFATQVVTNVCTFNGDDLILISTTNDDTAYNFRVDIMGNISSGPGVSPDLWGVNSAYIKGGCSTEIAHKTFNIADWSFILLKDVDNANPNRNVALGTQVVGPTVFDGSTWSNLEPDQSRTAVISSSFTGAANTFIACNLTITSQANVNFNSNGATSNSIVIYGNLIVDGTLTIGDTESLVAYNPNASLGTITKIEKSNPLIDINDNTYWSSPVQGSQISSIFAGVAPERIFEFRAGETNPIYAGTNYKYWWIASGAMGRAVGYAAPGASTGVQTLTFTGIPFNGPFTLEAFFSGTVDTGTANENFNLIGNPYPAAIDIQRILEDNGSINEIALWTHDTTVDPITGEYDDADYVYYSTTGSSTPGVTENIGSSQGFMARTVTNDGIGFNDSYKLIGRNDQFYKSTTSKKAVADKSEADKIWLRLKYGREKSDILIGFMEDATDGYDLYHEATGNLYNDNISLNEKNIKFYSQIDDDKFVIQGLGNFDYEKSVPLGFDTKKTGSHKISIAQTEGLLNSSDVYLVDGFLNVRHDLKRSDYEFYADNTGEFPNRFALEFANKDIDSSMENVLDKNEFMVMNEFDMMKIKSGKAVNEIKVFDLLGRMIIQQAPNAKSFQLNIGSVKIGTIMLIEARLDDGTLINKKSIKY